jgi:ATP phosphoribosyltransferase
MKKLINKNIKIAVQKNGRLTEDTINLLKSAGLSFATYNQTLFAVCRNFPVEILYLRDDDIPNCVASGVVDLGIVGQNIVDESCLPVNKLLDLNFGYCSLAVAVPKESNIKKIKDLEGCRIATSYPNSVNKFFNDQNIKIKTVDIKGSVEISPSLGMADAIVDIVSTGSTLALHDLRRLKRILESRATLIAGKQKKSLAKEKIINQLLLRFQGILAATSYKYIMMNAPEKIIKDIQKIVPGLKSPTLTPLMKKDWFSVQTVVREDVFWETVEKLRSAGATGIIVLPIEKLIP